MYEDLSVKYLFINLKYPTYVKLQTALIIGWLIAATLFYIFASESSVWILRNAWWICLAIGLLEILESQFAIRKAKSSYHAKDPH